MVGPRSLRIFELLARAPDFDRFPCDPCLLLLLDEHRAPERLLCLNDFFDDVILDLYDAPCGPDFSLRAPGRAGQLRRAHDWLFPRPCFFIARPVTDRRAFAALIIIFAVLFKLESFYLSAPDPREISLPNFVDVDLLLRTGTWCPLFS